MSECKTKTVNMISGHASSMTLAVTLAARGVNSAGMAGLLAEAERVGRLADAMCALLGSLIEREGCNTCEALLRDASECCYGSIDRMVDGVHQRRALRAGLIQAAAVLNHTD